MVLNMNTTKILTDTSWIH